MNYETCDALKTVRACYPEMSPYVGEQCAAGNETAMLIGESHYLREDTACDTTPDVWYAGKSVLDDTDKIWIDTAGILRDEIPNGIKNRAHSIWKLSALTINAAGPHMSGNNVEILKSIYARVVAFNFFLRPARQGESLGLQLSKIDTDVARLNFREQVEWFNPRFIVVLSSLVGNCLDREFLNRIGIPYVVAPHPGCPYWNKKCRKYGDKRGRDLVLDFVRSLNWK